MHRNKIEAANALTARISNLITTNDTTTFAKPNMTNKELWEKVRTVSGSSSKKQSNPVPGITAELLNNHYASISTDKKCIQPTKKTVENEFQNTVEEFEVFNMLDNMKATSVCWTGQYTILVSESRGSICFQTDRSSIQSFDRIFIRTETMEI